MTGEIRLLAVGDLHLRSTAPAVRKDDFLMTMDRKLDFIFETARNERTDAVVFPGDVFDKSNPPHGLVEYAVRKFKDSGLTFLFVYGQHDLRYHTLDKKNSPLGVLATALGKNAIVLCENSFDLVAQDVRVRVYGSSWGESIPETLSSANSTKEKSVGTYAVFVLHRPVTVDRLPWTHEYLLHTSELVDACPGADVFVVGDNHKRFIDVINDVQIVNMGSVMRQTADQKFHDPGVEILTFGKSGISNKFIPIPIESDVFEADETQDKEERDQKLADLASMLQKDYNSEMSFKEHMDAVMRSMQPCAALSILIEAMESAKNE